MLSFEFKNMVYFNKNGSWLDASYVIVDDELQKLFDRIFSFEINIDVISIDELIELGDCYKSARFNVLALECFENVLSRCSYGDYRLSGLYPRLSSCYRKIRRPDLAISLYKKLEADENTVLSFSPAFLTSVAAAYCDTGRWETGRRLASRARIIAEKSGKSTEEVFQLFARIQNSGYR